MTTAPIDKEICWVFERDLSTLSCHAAIEIESLMINEYRGLKAVKGLADVISKSLSPAEHDPTKYSFIDPTTIVVMNRAIDDTNLSKRLNTIEDFIKESSLISVKLREITSDYEKTQRRDIDKLRSLRDFCLALSKQSSAYQQSFYDIEYQHPYRS